MNITSAQTFAREDDNLGNLRSRYNDSQRATLVKRPSERAQDLIDLMAAARLTGNRDGFYAAQAELKTLIELL